MKLLKTRGNFLVELNGLFQCLLNILDVAIIVKIIVAQNPDWIDVNFSGISVDHGFVFWKAKIASRRKEMGVIKSSFESTNSARTDRLQFLADNHNRSPAWRSTVFLRQQLLR